MSPSEVEQLLKELREEGKIPKVIPADTQKAMARSLSRYFTDISKKKLSEFTEKAKEIAEKSLRTEEVARGKGVTVEEGGSIASGRKELTEFLQSHGAENIASSMNMDFFLGVARQVAEGASKQIIQNWDQTRVDEFPALELVRVYDRVEPRGTKDPTDAWDDENGRWVAACNAAEDDAALEVFEDTGRMIALKNSDVWDELGNGAGGYTDTLGNAFSPFAFNSGMDTDEVPYDDCVAVGLIDEGDTVEPAELDLGNLIQMESGGHGSGNWGHEGRPGAVGGSGEGGGEPSVKVTRARASYKPSTAAKRRVSEKYESNVADMIGGHNLSDNEPADVVKGKNAIEVKTIVEGKHDKITMHPDSLARKVSYARKNKVKWHTVVIDARGDKPVYYYRKGVGSFRLNTMKPIDPKELKDLI